MGALADIYSRMILKAANPLWEGDKFQPPGQPRGKGGRFSGGGRSAARAAGRMLPPVPKGSGPTPRDRKPMNASNATTARINELSIRNPDEITAAEFEFLNKVQSTPRSSPNAYKNAEAAQKLMQKIRRARRGA